MIVEKRDKRGQSANEAVLIMTFMTFFLIVTLAAVSDDIITASNNNYKALIQDIADVIEQEALIAFGSEDGYFHAFNLPQSLNGQPYSVSFLNSTTIGSQVNISMLFVSSENTNIPLNVTRLLPRGVHGNLIIGRVFIKKEKGLVTINSKLFPPLISTITPSSGTIYGSTPVIITGANFGNTPGVSFGGVAATGVVLLNQFRLQALTPAHAAGAVDITVTNPDGQSATLSNGYNYVDPPPSVTGVSPPSGPTAGGASVTVNGANFYGTPAVKFGGVASPSVTFVNSNQLTAVTPAHAAGAVDITVTNPDGQSATLGSQSCSGLMTATFYPDANPETTSVDGGVERVVGAGSSWSDIRDGAGTGTTNSGAWYSVRISTTDTNLPRLIYRSIYLFDTSALPDTAIVSAATLSIYGHAKTDSYVPAGNPSFNIYTATPTSNTVLTASDYGQIGTIAQSTAISYADWSNTGYNDFALNDMTQISKTGVSKFGARNANYDVANIQPSSTVATQEMNFYTYFSEQGDGYKPKLVVTYSIPCFTYTAASPTILNLNPSSGSVSGGTSVTVNGANFYGTPTVKFGGVAAPSVTFVNANQLTAVTPAHAAGSVAVAVTNPDSQSGTLLGGFTYVQPPAVAGIAPSSGPSSGGTSVTITGSSFISTPTVRIGGSLAGSVVFVSSTTLTARTPSGSLGPADVRVTNPDGQSGTLAGGFTYVPPPAVASVSPSSGPFTGGTTITINGANFVSPPTVEVGGSAASSVVFVSSTQLRATTPAGSIGPRDVRVTNPDGQSGTLSGGFAYTSEGAVFITSVATYKGNLGGLAGADAKCQALANAASLGGTWRAWLSTTTINAKDRILDRKYYRLDRQLVANNLADLTDGSISNAITVTETGVSRSGLARTGTQQNGIFKTGDQDCMGWTSSSSSIYGRRGYASSTMKDGRWTDYAYSFCSSLGTLYCFWVAP